MHWHLGRDVTRARGRWPLFFGPVVEYNSIAILLILEIINCNRLCRKATRASVPHVLFETNQILVNIVLIIVEFDQMVWLLWLDQLAVIWRAMERRWKTAIKYVFWRNSTAAKTWKGRQLCLQFVVFFFLFNAINHRLHRFWCFDFSVSQNLLTSTVTSMRSVTIWPSSIHKCFSFVSRSTKHLHLTAESADVYVNTYRRQRFSSYFDDKMENARENSYRWA